MYLKQKKLLKPIDTQYIMYKDFERISTEFKDIKNPICFNIKFNIGKNTWKNMKNTFYIPYVLINRYTIVGSVVISVAPTIMSMIGACIVFWSFNHVYEKYIKEKLVTIIALIVIGSFSCGYIAHKYEKFDEESYSKDIYETVDGTMIMFLDLGYNYVSLEPPKKVFIKIISEILNANYNLVSDSFWN